MATKPILPLRLDLSGALSPVTNITLDDVESLAPKLWAARKQLLTEERFQNFEHPAKLLAEYKQVRKRSELGRILLAAHRWLYVVDRVVVLGTHDSHLAPLAFMAACCEPYYDQLTRGERGGRPRVIFKTHHFDNDATQGLLALLGNGRQASSLEDRWGLIVIDSPNKDADIFSAYRQFWSALQSSLGEKALSLVLPVTYADSDIQQHAQALNLPELFLLPTTYSPPEATFTATSLLPAAMLGIDVPRLLNGAAQLTEHFRTARFEENLVLQIAAINCLLNDKSNFWSYRLRAWSQGLDGVVRWYEQALSDHSLVPPSECSCRLNLIVDQWRHDAMVIPSQDNATMPELLSRQIEQTQQADRTAHRPSIDLHLPRCDEAAIGQLMQLLALTEVVEGIATRME